MTTSPSINDKFPNELLCQIFVEAIVGSASPALFDNGDDECSHTKHDGVDEVADLTFPPLHDFDAMNAISLVCRQWNGCLLSQSELWATAIRADRDSLSRTKMLVERARNHSLRMNSYCSFAQIDNWEYLYDEVRNWDTFSLQTKISENYCFLLLNAFFHHPAPQLTALTLRNEDDLDTMYGMTERPFPGSSPPLKIFVLRNILFPLGFDHKSLWKNLTVLKLEHSLEFPVPELNAANWLEMLRTPEHLQHLELSGFGEFGELSDLDLSQIQDVSFNNLSRLILKTVDDRSVLCDLFSKLVLPSACRVSILLHCHSSDTSQRPTSFPRLKIGLDRYFKRLASYYIEKKSQTMLRLSHVNRDPNTFVAKVFEENDLHPYFYIKQIVCQPSTTSRISIADIPDVADPAEISLLLSSLEYLSPERLGIHKWRKITPRDVIPLWRLVSSYRNVAVCECAYVDPMILALLKGKRDVVDQGSYLLPKLEWLSFDKETVPEVEEYLEWRRSIGKPIRLRYHNVEELES